MAAAVCRFAGARHVVVTDVNPYRLELAGKLGATRVVDVSRESLAEVQEELGMKEGFDVALEMSGHPSGLRDALEHASNGAKVSLLGIFPGPVEIDWDKVIFKGLLLKGIYGREMFETWYKDDLHDPGRAGRFPGHHPPLPGRRVREGLRDDDVWPVREGGVGLGVIRFRKLFYLNLASLSLGKKERIKNPRSLFRQNDW